MENTQNKLTELMRVKFGAQFDNAVETNDGQLLSNMAVSVMSDERNRLGLTQATLGKSVGMSRSATGRNLSGKTDPQLSSVIRLMIALGL